MSTQDTREVLNYIQAMRRWLIDGLFHTSRAAPIGVRKVFTLATWLTLAESHRVVWSRAWGPGISYAAARL